MTREQVPVFEALQSPVPQVRAMVAMAVVAGHQQAVQLEEPTQTVFGAEHLRGRFARQQGVPVDSQAWPINDVVEKLAIAAEHLLRDHDCDHEGYEQVNAALAAYRAGVPADRPQDDDPFMSEAELVQSLEQRLDSFRIRVAQAAGMTDADIGLYEPDDDEIIEAVKRRGVPADSADLRERVARELCVIDVEESMISPARLDWGALGQQAKEPYLNRADRILSLLPQAESLQVDRAAQWREYVEKRMALVEATYEAGGLCTCGECDLCLGPEREAVLTSAETTEAALDNFVRTLLDARTVQA